VMAEGPEKVYLTEKQKEDFWRDGYLIVPSLLVQEELDAVRRGLAEDESVVNHAFELNDGAGLKSRLSLWNHPGNDITGMVARAKKAVNPMEELLGGEVYHYHTKLMMKEAFTGGRFVWHQDYGYWYKNGWLFSDMGTIFIALDACNKVNGCLQVLRGSHKMGRIDHLMIGGQTGADLARVEEAMKVMDVVHVELNPGDAIYFHCNLLHKSDQNTSPYPRYAFLIAYNRADNVSGKPHHHPLYTKLYKVEDDEIKNCTTKETKGKDFMNPKEDATIIAHDYH